MFTGLVEEVATVQRIHQVQHSAHLEIRAQTIMDDMRLGDSIAVNGVCLTVVQKSSSGFTADAVPETMRRTNLGSLTPGSQVNVERALQASSRLGGHIVSGHVDGVGRLQAIEQEGLARILVVQTPLPLMRYITDKGSICLNGVSLTVMGVTKDTFSISIIPHTSAHTTLMHARPGDILNLECDVIAKYVEKLLTPNLRSERDASADEAPKSAVSLDFLAQNGFLS